MYIYVYLFIIYYLYILFFLLLSFALSSNPLLNLSNRKDITRAQAGGEAAAEEAGNGDDELTGVAPLLLRPQPLWRCFSRSVYRPIYRPHLAHPLTPIHLPTNTYLSADLRKGSRGLAARDREAHW